MPSIAIFSFYLFAKFSLIEISGFLGNSTANLPPFLDLETKIFQELPNFLKRRTFVLCFREIYLFHLSSALELL